MVALTTLATQTTALISRLQGTLRWPYAHLPILWLGPLLGWVCLWQMAWRGAQGGWWIHGNGLAFAGWWLACCLHWLEPPKEGTYMGQKGRLYASALYAPLAQLRFISQWLAAPALITSWWLANAGIMVTLLSFLAILAWAPLLQPRIWLGEKGVWSLGSDIRYVAFATVTNHGWLDADKSLWVVEREAGWPVEVALPNEEAARALENAISHANNSPSDTHDDIAVLWPHASRHWLHHVAAITLALGWGAWWLWAGWGANARLSQPLSAGSFALLGMGLLVGLQWSRWTPTWWGMSIGLWGRCTWQNNGPAGRAFRWAAAPGALLALGIATYHLSQQCWRMSPLFFSLWSAVGWLVVISLSLWVLSDPTGSVVWLCEQNGETSQKKRWLRRYGWVEDLGSEEA